MKSTEDGSRESAPKVRMRLSKKPLTRARLERCLRLHGVSGAVWREYANCSLADYVAWNNGWTEQDFGEFELPDLLEYAEIKRWVPEPEQVEP